MVEVRVVDRIVGGVAPETLLSVFQVGHDAVALGAVDAARGGGREARFAADEQVSGGGVAGAELAGTVEQARIGSLAVALPVVHGAAARDQRRQRYDKQSAQSHGAVRALRASLTALPAAAAKPEQLSRRPTSPASPLPYISRDSLGRFSVALNPFHVPRSL